MPPKRNKAASPAESSTMEACEGRSTRSVPDGTRTNISESNPTSETQEPSLTNESHTASSSSARNTRSTTSTGAVPKTATTTRTRSITATATRSSSRTGGTKNSTGAAPKTADASGAVTKTEDSTGAKAKTGSNTGTAASNKTGAVLTMSRLFMMEDGRLFRKGSTSGESSSSTGASSSSMGASSSSTELDTRIANTAATKITKSKTTSSSGASARQLRQASTFVDSSRSNSTTAPASRSSDGSVTTSRAASTDGSNTSAEEASSTVIVDDENTNVEDNTVNPAVWDMTVDLTSPIRSNISEASNVRSNDISTASNMRGTGNLGILGNLNELTIASPSTPSPQRGARRPRTPLARNTLGSRYTMSPSRQHNAVDSYFAASPPRLDLDLTSYLGPTATPPRSHNVFDMTIDLTDSPLASPASPEESSPAATAGGSRIRCPVCLDGLPHITSTRRTMMSTVCGHLFCSSCLPACIRSNGRCPTCRKILRPYDMHPIFI